MKLNNAPRVGFMLIGGKDWTGGYNYLINLLDVLALEMPTALVPVLFVGQDVSEEDLRPFRKILDCDVIVDPAFNANKRSIVLLRSLFFGSDASINCALRNANIDVVFEAANYFGWRFRFPVIAWIPDLQHRLMPRLFNHFAWVRRELGFRLQIWSGRSVMCSSLDTLKQIERLYPASRNQVAAVRFAITPSALHDSKEILTIVSKYELPENFFFMPNQFWVHKNHELVLKALQIIISRGCTCTILATGLQVDPRNKYYAPRLLSDIRAAGLQKYFLTPGLVPHEDLFPLMQASNALINPSLFEGWSTAVEEAKSAGIPMILSDIAVHREQAGEDALYFNPNSPEDLANLLITYSPLGEIQRKKQSEIARENAKIRIKHFAMDFANVVYKSIERYESNGSKSHLL